MAIGINVGASLEQLFHHVIVSHLRRNPQRSGAIRAPGVGNGSLCQQEHEYLEVAVLSCDEQRRGTVLSAHTLPIIMQMSWYQIFSFGNSAVSLQKNMKAFSTS
jgi:hypothetical protein